MSPALPAMLFSMGLLISLLSDSINQSDNESAPSPVKSQPKVPYCKTYEQMRLEEIQAESAAYYSYETGNDARLFCNQAVIVKAKSISANRWVNSPKTEKLGKELDFKVLSLEEIRRRKKEKELAAKASTERSSKPSSPIEMTRSVKKRSIEQYDEENSVSPSKKRRISSEFIKNSESALKIPPIKLRRSPKTAIAKGTETKSCKDAIITMDGQGDEVSCRERLESHSDESINVSRRSVEIRLCDSSTNEEKTQTQLEQATDDRKSVATYTMEDIMNSALLSSRSYVNTEDEYLRLDTSSDDIMRDIEDLLK